MEPPSSSHSGNVPVAMIAANSLVISSCTLLRASPRGSYFHSSIIRCLLLLSHIFDCRGHINILLLSILSLCVFRLISTTTRGLHTPESVGWEAGATVAGLNWGACGTALAFIVLIPVVVS
ncbi:hypothetical protein HAX54_043120 [Datura stramonium]|uniref:Uncharacterized protein n=1 Tax=Datura stramonium TaxID=4076 RepID=A0ABS8SMZ2_DATST|nr:hypothetical protein [Datura stramonium]